MSGLRWDHYNELISLREAMNRLFEESFVRPAGAASGQLAGRTTRSLPLDVYQTDNEVVIKASVPGARPQNVEISIQGDTVAIRGEIEAESGVEEDAYLHRERPWGSFSRQIVIPIPLEAEKAEARYSDGVLTLTIPKAAAAKPKQIKVKPVGQI